MARDVESARGPGILITTHIVTSGIAGTLVTHGAGLRYHILGHILLAWVLTLPITILISGVLDYCLTSPQS